MRIVGVTMVRNESDIVEAFVRHHAQILDHLSIHCHFCQDRTPEILASLEREGLPISVRHDDRPIHDQGTIMTRLARDAVRGGAHVVVALDADEFLIATGEEDARAALESLPADAVTLVPWRTYVIAPDDPPDEPVVLRRLRHRPRHESHLGKAVLPGGLVAHGARLEVGSHHVLDRRGRAVRSRPTDELALAHFPVRSEAQLRAKVLGGWPSTYANPHRWPEQNEHWRDLYAECRRNPSLPPERLQAIPLGYTLDTERPELVLDPVEARFELRYPVERADPDAVFDGTVLGLAEEVRRLSAAQPPLAWRLYATVRRRLSRR